RGRSTGLLHARVVTAVVGHRHVTHLPGQAQVGTHAEHARGTDVTDHQGVRIQVRELVVLAGVGALPVDGELANAGFRHTVLHAQVVTFRLQLTEVGEAEEHVGDRTGRVAGDAVAARRDARHVAVTQDAVDRVLRDDVLEADVVPVEVDVQAFD